MLQSDQNYKDLLQTQIDLESYMRKMTIERFHKLHKNAEDRGEFGNSNTGRYLIGHLEESMFNTIKAFQKTANSGKAGPKHRAVSIGLANHFQYNNILNY